MGPRSWGTALVMLCALALFAPGAAQARGIQDCAAPALDFREQQFDDNGRPLYDTDGAPRWQPALATGSAGESHQLTSVYIVPGNARLVDHDGIVAISLLSMTRARC